MAKPKSDPATWPQLSLQLPFERHPNRCQGCGALGKIDELDRWLECDNSDRPTSIVVLLCKHCSEELIERHPRLYHQMDIGEPRPGLMAPCADCRDRDGLTCRSKAAKFNGGPGLEYSPMPSPAHVCRRGRGQRSGIVWIGEPVEKCSGFVPIEAEHAQ